MSIGRFWGIAPTTDKAAIRHAYAQKNTHLPPGRDPEGFDALHKAFTAAMRAARQGEHGGDGAGEPDASAAPAVSVQQNSAEARRAAAEAARAARRAAEQQAVEQYASRAQRRAGKIIQWARASRRRASSSTSRRWTRPGAGCAGAEG